MSKHFSNRVFTACILLKDGRYNVLFQPTLHGTATDDLVPFGYIDMGKSACGDKEIPIVRDELSDYTWLLIFQIQTLRSLLEQ